MTGLFVVLIAVGAALAIGWYRRAADGRIRDVAEGAPRLTPAELGRELGSGATFVQFSAAVCAPCRAAHTLLSGLVADNPALAHIDLDAEERFDLVERFGIMRTPTVLVLDATGAVRQRFAGVPRKPEVLAALAMLPPAA